MLDYLKHTGRNRTAEKKLLGVLETNEILLYTPCYGAILSTGWSSKQSIQQSSTNQRNV